jgi:hypothetical protein
MSVVVLRLHWPTDPNEKECAENEHRKAIERVYSASGV